MPRACLVCTHPEREKIDRKLATTSASISGIARDFKTSEDALWRHERRHLDPRLVEEAKKTAAAEDKGLVARVTRIVDRIEKRAEQCDDYGAVEDLLKVVRELRPYHELFGKANGQLATDRVNALFVNLGVRSEDELRGRLALTSGTDNLTPEEVCESICESAETLFRKHPELYVRTMRRLERASIAVEVNGNGHAE